MKPVVKQEAIKIAKIHRGSICRASEYIGVSISSNSFNNKQNQVFLCYLNLEMQVKIIVVRFVLDNAICSLEKTLWFVLFF